MVGNFVLGTFLAYNCTLLALKMKYVKIEEKMKNSITKNGLYHITSEESAQKIMESGHIRPSGIVSSLGARKTFFFAGIPTIDMLRENVAASSEQFEWTAIQVKPDENDLSNYRIRAYDDNSVVCKGKCILEEGKVRKVSLVLDLNQDGLPYIREKTPEEIEKGYEPSEELKQKFKVSNNSLVVTRNLMKAYFRKPVQLLSKLITSDKWQNKQQSLNEKTIAHSISDNRKKFIEKYKVTNDIKSTQCREYNNYIQDKEIDER